MIAGNGTDAYYPFTLAEVREYLNDSTLSVQDIIVIAMNTDYDAARYVITSLNWHGDSILMFLSGNLPNGQLMRINFVFMRKL